MKCTCTNQDLKNRRNYCPRFDQKMIGHLLDICRDTCDPPCPNREAYLIRWSQRANQVTGPRDAVNLAARMTGVKPMLVAMGLLRKFRSNRDRYRKWQSARRKWKAAGKPIRPEAEQHEILEVICPDCDHHQGEGKSLSCGKCGCWARDGRFFTGKVTMATEHCPIGIWPGEANYGKLPEETGRVTTEETNAAGGSAQDAAATHSFLTSPVPRVALRVAWRCGRLLTSIHYLVLNSNPKGLRLVVLSRP